MGLLSQPPTTSPILGSLTSTPNPWLKPEAPEFIPGQGWEAFCRNSQEFSPESKEYESPQEEIEPGLDHPIRPETKLTVISPSNEDAGKLDVVTETTSAKSFATASQSPDLENRQESAWLPKDICDEVCEEVAIYSSLIKDWLCKHGRSFEYTTTNTNADIWTSNSICCPSLTGNCTTTDIAGNTTCTSLWQWRWIISLFCEIPTTRIHY